MFAGAIVALVVSIVHSQTFNFDVFGWSGLITWYLVSFLLGCAVGFVAGLLISLIAVRQNSFVAFVGGALFGALSYMIQVYLFLIYVFSNTSWE